MNLPTEISLATFQPPGGWLHYLNILHYLLLLGGILLLGASGSKSPLLFIIVTAVLMLITAADLYSNLLGLSLFIVFLMRVGMFGIPVVIAGLGPTERARGLGILVAILAFPILVALFLGAWFPILSDPRL